MNHYLAAFAALGLALAGGCSVLGNTADGVIGTVDEASKTMSLVDGQRFTLESTNELTDVEVGEQVTITYYVRDGENVVSSIFPSEPNE